MDTPLPPISEADLATLPPWAQALIAALLHENAELRARVAALEARLAKNSSNSSKPPSSDPPWKPRPRGKESTGRKRGGQPGHEPHSRQLLEPGECDEVVEHRLGACSGCGASLEGVEPTGEVVRHQQSELPARPVVVTEHRAPTIVCPRCRRRNRAAVPAGSRRMLGPRLAATAALLAGNHHLGRRDVQELLASAFAVRISLGALSQAEKTVASALAAPCEAVHAEVVAAPVINIDDTPYFEGVAPESKAVIRAGARLARMARKATTQLWVARSADASYFRVVKSRGRDVVDSLLAGADGVVVSDRLASFLHLANERRQVCWAHLLRDFEKMYESTTKGASTLGDLLAFKAGEVFAAWGKHRAGELDFAALGRAIEPLRESITRILTQGPGELGAGDTARRTCENLVKLGPALWTFARVEGVEPTNNAAEQALRRGSRWRKRSYGTMSERGSRFAERILTISTTLRQRRADVLGYVADAISAHVNSLEPPPLPKMG
jgi:transposase